MMHDAAPEQEHESRSETTESKNKTLVLEAFNAAFNERDPSAYERYWSFDYVQHSAHIAPGRDGLRALIASQPSGLKYEHDLIVAEGDLVVVHGRYSGFAPTAWVVSDFVRVVDGKLVEHWDVIEDEVPRESSASGLPMFGTEFPN